MDNKFNIFNCFNDIYYVTCSNKEEIIWKSNLYTNTFSDAYDSEFVLQASSTNSSLPKKIGNDFYQVKSIPFEIEGNLYYLNKVKISDEIFVSNAETSSIYQNLVTTLSSINIKDPIQIQINQIITYIQKIFVADRVSILSPGNDSFPYHTVKADGAADFYYNPILKDVINNDEDFQAQFNKEKYLYVDINQLDNYPILRETMLKDKNDNFIIFKWNIDDEIIYLVMENCKNIVNDKEVYSTLYYHLYFVLESCLYNKNLYMLSNIDVLTEVYNRNRYTMDYDILNKEKLDKTTVLFIDLDNLKTINDLFGHTLGDKLIRASAKIIKESFSFGNVYRIGGDEFIVVCKNTSYDDVSIALSEMKARMYNGKIFCSYGISYREVNGNFNEMVSEAEREMYINKRRHHDKYSNDVEKSAMAIKLEEEIKNNCFSFVLQPKFELKNMNFIGAEALVRYNGENSWSLPHDFIPIFENSCCVDLIDYFMIEEVLKLQKSIIEKYGKTYPISINISSQTFLLDKFVDDFVELLDRYDIPNNLIILELTDRVNFSSRKVMMFSEKLNENSINIEFDDFVTNSINLKVLENSVFSTIKIDKTSYGTIIEDSILQKIVKIIIQECHSKNVKVLAEGVENEKDLEFVKSMDFDSAQGFYFDKPLSKAEYIEKYIKNRK